MKFKIVIILLFILSVGYTMFLHLSNPKTAYVDVSYLYNNFDYKVELEGELDKIQSMRQNVLDSLMYNLELRIGQIKSKEKPEQNDYEMIKLLKEEYYLKEKQFGEENTALAQEYTDKILGQLNQYILDFGKLNKYEYLFGANSNGAIMYAKDSKNITEEALEYINYRYSGGKQ